MTEDADDIGTSRWFGKSWGAPVCDPRAHIVTPIGELCLGCDVPIRLGDQGVTHPVVPFDNSTAYRAAYHLNCFLAEIVGVTDIKPT